MSKVVLFIVICLFFFNNIVLADILSSDSSLSEDLDPLIDIFITIEIKSIRFLEKTYNSSNPNFLLKIFINDVEFNSQIWYNSSFLYNCWSESMDIPDDEEQVIFRIELWEKIDDKLYLCDIGNEKKDALIIYNIKTGKWNGDDYINDPSGYGRLNGCDDGSFYLEERDCELFFNIYQNDFDNDTIPYWSEIYQYETDPFVNNYNDDLDNDSIPFGWEHFWGYNPLKFDNHNLLDVDNDSISNFEEYLTQHYNSDPYRKDIFLEIDWMEEGSNGEINEVPVLSSELLKNPFNRRNFVFHVDIGIENGGELIPFKTRTEQTELFDLYNDYFLHNGTYNWRRGIFHYGIFVNSCIPKGYAFSGDTEPFWGYNPGTNCFVVSSRLMDEKNNLFRFRNKPLEYFYGSVIMHEMGHNFGIRFGEPFGCDNWFGKYPWQISFWLIRNYYSIMNYQYTYYRFDYSDGTNGWGDYDDWSNINLSYFEVP